MNVKKQNIILRNIEITGIAAEGKAIARFNPQSENNDRAGGMVIFVKGAVPGDIADLEIFRKKKNHAEAKVIKFHKFSEKRNEPFCTHFGICGGCVWQNLKYEEQLFYKQKQVEDAFVHIGKMDKMNVEKLMLPIIPSKNIKYYRNKLEFAFSNKRWLTIEEIKTLPFTNNLGGALGFHIAGLFDKVLDIQHCYLQPSLSNEIRLAIKKHAEENHLAFFNFRTQEGFLRNVIIRNSSLGEWMVVLVFTFNPTEENGGAALLKDMSEKFPQITSLQFIVNPKKNDSIFDLKVELFKGRSFFYEQLGDLKFKISAKSFFQTNTGQALELYKTVKNFLTLSPGSKNTEHVIAYDLYTGTGTIANYIAREVKKVIGIDYISDAIEDAKENSLLNNICNTEFFAGDMKDILTNDFINMHGKPDIIITDPPRAGMDEKVVMKILEIEPEKIIYVSCNAATQARDAAMLSQKYSLVKLQPVDMFPHTHHVENVAMLVRVNAY